MSQAEFHATLFVCQGSPEPAWREPYDRIVEAYRLTHPDERVELAFCEAMAPGLAEIIDELAIDLCDRVRVMSVDLAPDGAGERILDSALRAAARRWPELHFVRIAVESGDLDALRRADRDADPDIGRPADDALELSST